MSLYTEFDSEPTVLPIGSIVVLFFGLPYRNHKKELQWSLKVELKNYSQPSLNPEQTNPNSRGAGFCSVAEEADEMVYDSSIR